MNIGYFKWGKKLVRSNYREERYFVLRCFVIYPFAYILIYCAFLYSTLLRLADVLWNSQIPLLICRTYGLVGYMRIIIKEHPGKIVAHMGLAFHCFSYDFRT